MNNNPTFFLTTNLKLASALSAAGFEIFSVDRIENAQGQQIVCEIAAEHNNVKAHDLAAGFDDFARSTHGDKVDEIARNRGLTPEEQTLIAFDAARTAGHNRVALLKAAPQQPMMQISAGAGRLLQFRKGTSKEELKRLCK